MNKTIVIAATVLMLLIPMQVYAREVKTTDYYWQDVSNAQLRCADEYLDLMAELNDCEDLGAWYDRYLSLLTKYSDICDLPETIYDYYSSEDIEYLLRMCETECHGKDFASKVHVFEVALNRIASKKFPNSGKEVVTAPSQFCYSRKITEVTKETRKALECAFQIPDLTGGCLYFHSIKECDNFLNKECVFVDKAGHKFYM